MGLPTSAKTNKRRIHVLLQEKQKNKEQAGWGNEKFSS